MTHDVEIAAVLPTSKETCQHEQLKKVYTQAQFNISNLAVPSSEATAAHTLMNKVGNQNEKRINILICAVPKMATPALKVWNALRQFKTCSLQTQTMLS